jgi:hypothetical protein
VPRHRGDGVQHEAILDIPPRSGELLLDRSLPGWGKIRKLRRRRTPASSRLEEALQNDSAPRRLRQTIPGRRTGSLAILIDHERLCRLPVNHRAGRSGFNGSSRWRIKSVTSGVQELQEFKELQGFEEC